MKIQACYWRCWSASQVGSQIRHIWFGDPWRECHRHRLREVCSVEWGNRFEISHGPLRLAFRTVCTSGHCISDCCTSDNCISDYYTSDNVHFGPWHYYCYYCCYYYCSVIGFFHLPTFHIYGWFFFHRCYKMETGWLRIINPGYLSVDVVSQFVTIDVAIGVTIRRDWRPIWLAVENIRSSTTGCPGETSGDVSTLSITLLTMFFGNLRRKVPYKKHRGIWGTVSGTPRASYV